MVDINKKREKEKKTLRVMIGVYCRGKHKHKGELCPECQKLLDYALLRTEKCPFMETKTFCSNCSVHCYILQCLQSALLFKRDAGKDQRSYEVCRTENVVLSSASGAGSYVGDNERKNEKEIGEEK